MDKKASDIDKLLKQVEPQDLIKFGLIPEFIGRVPVTVSLELLTEDALLRILKEPKNALVKQYQKLFEMDDVKLEFKDEALRAVAKLAMERKTGARGLRSIMESAMMDLMMRYPRITPSGSVPSHRRWWIRQGDRRSSTGIWQCPERHWARGLRKTEGRSPDRTFRGTNRHRREMGALRLPFPVRDRKREEERWKKTS